MTRHTILSRWLMLTLFLLVLFPASLTLAQTRTDRDGDGLPNGADSCPDAAGPRENGGCPVSAPGENPVNTGPSDPNDPDDDGIIGGSDFCPDAGGPASNNGCPEGVNPIEVIPDAPSGITPTPVPARPLPTLPADDCMAATQNNERVNIRSIPTTGDVIVGAMNPQVLYPVSAYFTNGNGEKWWRIPLGWVASWVTRAGRNCEGIPSFESLVGDLDFNDKLMGALEPDDPQPGGLKALFPLPNYADISQLPVQSVTCDASVFVGVVGAIQLPPDPCKFDFPDGLTLEIIQGGIRLKHAGEFVGVVDTDPGKGDGDSDSPPPFRFTPGALVAYFEAGSAQDLDETSIGTTEPTEGGASAKTIVIHAPGKPGGGMLIIGPDDIPSGALLESLLQEPQWKKMKGSPNDGEYDLDLGTALEFQHCNPDKCLNLLFGQPSDSDAPSPPGGIKGVPGGMFGGAGDVNTESSPTPQPSGGLKAVGSGIFGVGGAVNQAIQPEGDTSSDGSEDTSRTSDQSLPEGLQQAEDDNSGLTDAIAGMFATIEHQAEEGDTSALDALNDAFHAAQTGTPQPDLTSPQQNEMNQNPNQDCSSLILYDPFTTVTPGSNCPPGAILGASYYQGGTVVVLHPVMNPDGSTVASHKSYQILCYKAGQPVLSLAMPYGFIDAFGIAEGGWDCNVIPLDFTLN